MGRYPASEKDQHRFRETVLEWYRDHGRMFPWRETDASDYQKIVAEMLLQRTKAETVAQHYPNIIGRYPSWEALANANDADLIDVLRPLGLWRTRKSTLKKLAIEIVRLEEKLPRQRNEIEILPGIGQYIASSILLLCHGEHEPLLDGNMARVVERYFQPRKLRDIRYDPFLQHLCKRIVDCSTPIAINWAILDFAAAVCVARAPKCNACPMARHCNYVRTT